VEPAAKPLFCFQKRKLIAIRPQSELLSGSPMCLKIFFIVRASVCVCASRQMCCVPSVLLGDQINADGVLSGRKACTRR
jgi:hypothetical protein